MKPTNDEINAIYYCISSTMDLRDDIEWESEEQYWSEWDNYTKHINLALRAANRLAGYDN